MNLPFGFQPSATARLAVPFSFSHYFSISCKLTLLEKNKTGDIPLINISKQFYVFPYGESLEPFFVKLPECDHSQCNTVLFVTDWVQRQMPWSDHTGQHLNSLYNLPGGEGAG